MRASPRPRGFTLLELIAVIVVLGIVSALALPRLIDRAGLQSRGFIDALRAALQHARAVAVASGCDVRVSVSATSAGDQLRLDQGTGCVAPAAFDVPVPDPVEAGANQVVTAPVGMSLTAVPANFVFDALGRINGGNATLTVGGSGAGAPPITVFASTGFVQ